MNVKQILETLHESGQIAAIAASRLLGFGRDKRRYVLAESLPEVLTEKNVIDEVVLNLETVIAADGGRYSPAQIARIVRAMKVSIGLGHQDISIPLQGDDFDLFHEALGKGDELTAQAKALELVEKAILGLVEKNELQRCQGLGYGEIEVSGANGVKGTVPMELPAGHRAEFGGDLSDPDFNALEAFQGQVDLLEAGGHSLTKVVSSAQMVQAFLRNPSVREWVTGGNGIATRAKLAAALEAEYGAQLVTYDLFYTEQDGSRHRFLRPDAFILFGTTADEVGVTWEDEEGVHEFNLENVVGRVWIGKAAKQSKPGRAVEVIPGVGKAGGLTVEAWQTSIAGLVTPSAVAVLTLRQSEAPAPEGGEGEGGED